MKLEVVKNLDSGEINKSKWALFFERIRNNREVELCIIGLRFLMGMAFIPCGIVKVEGERFTRLGVETKIGYFFEALFQASDYWKFIGMMQLTAAFLLFTQKFAALGNLIFFVVISNIFIITVDLNFKGTWVITGMLMLSSIFLFIWDWYKYVMLVRSHGSSVERTFYREPAVIWQVIGMLLFFSLVFMIAIFG